MAGQHWQRTKKEEFPYRAISGIPVQTPPCVVSLPNILFPGRQLLGSVTMVAGATGPTKFDYLMVDRKALSPSMA